MNSDETVCPSCSLVYSQSNPPRLLTMCGHTYCDTCIRKLIVRKKFNHKYKVTCPSDGNQIELNNQHSSVFPVNISLLNMVKNNLRASTKNLDSYYSRTEPELSEQPQSNNESISICENSLKNSKISECKEFQFDEFDMCLLHQKPLQIVCVKQCKRICASCVIFGEHRGHKVKNYRQVEDLIKQSVSQLKQIQNRFRNSYQKISKQATLKQIEDKISKKKSETQHIIQQKFKELSQMLKETHKKILMKADKNFNSLKIKCQQILFQKINGYEQYSEWQQTLKTKLKLLQFPQEQQKFKFLFKEETFMEACQNIISQTQSIYPEMKKQIDTICQNVTVVFDRQQTINFFKEVCKIENCENSFLEINESRISFTKFEKEESLLDDIDTSELSLMVKSVDYGEQIKDQMRKTVHESRNIKEKISKESDKKTLSRMKSTQGRSNFRYYKSPQVSQVPSSKKIALQSKLLLNKGNNSKILRSLPQKYQKNLEQVLSGFADVFDLTGAQLGDQQLYSILCSIKQSPITIIKLVKNKLTDAGFQKIQNLISHTVMLNLSKNQLTIRTLSRIIQLKRQGKFQSLKSIMLSQNKIQQRKCKHEMELLRKMGVNICL